MKKTAKKHAFQILIWVLIVMMVAGIIALPITTSLESCNDQQNESTQNQENHDHDGDGKPDHTDSEHSQDGEVSNEDEDVDHEDDPFPEQEGSDEHNHD